MWRLTLCLLPSKLYVDKELHHTCSRSKAASRDDLEVLVSLVISSDCNSVSGIMSTQKYPLQTSRYSYIILVEFSKVDASKDELWKYLCIGF